MKRFKKLFFPAIVIFAMAAAMVYSAGCSSNAEYPVTLASYTINAEPQSVICLNDSVADIMLACGYGDKITARSNECTQAELASTHSVGSAAKPDVNEIKNLKPDIIFADKTLSEDVRSQLKNANFTVITLVPATSTEELTVLYGNIAAILGGNNTGRTLGTEKAEKLAMTLSDLQRVVPQSDIVITACYLYDVNGTAETENSLGGKLFDYANITNVCKTKESSGDIDSLILNNPQYIFCDTGVKAQIEGNERLKELSAVKSGNIYELPSKYLSRQGNSLTEALSFIIETIYEFSDNSGTDESSTVIESSTSEKGSEPEAVTVKADTSLTITPDLTIALYESSDNVTLLQNRLTYLGYFSENVTNYYGNMTAQSVLAFKQANGMTTDSSSLSSEELDVMFSENAIPADGFPKE